MRKDGTHTRADIAKLFKSGDANNVSLNGHTAYIVSEHESFAVVRSVECPWVESCLSWARALRIIRERDGAFTN